MVKQKYLFLLCFFLFSILVEASIDDSLKLMKNLREANNASEKTLALIKLSEFFQQNNLEKGLSYANEALQLALIEDDDKLIGRAYHNLGEINYGLGEYKLSIKNYESALKEFQSAKYKIGIGEAYEGIGKAAYKTGDKDVSLEKLSEALTIFEEEKYKNGLPGVYINIGILYDEAENFKQAIEFYTKALTIAIEIDDLTAEASCYTNLGSIYMAQKKYKESIVSLEKSIEIKEKLGNKKGKAVSLNNLGAVYYELNDMTKALYYFEEAMNTYIEINDLKGMFPSCNNVGSIYLDEKKYAKSIVYFDRALKIARELNSVTNQIVCLENLSTAHKGLGDYSIALDYSNECSSLKDTLYDRDQAEITAEMQTKFASEKKEQENEILNLKVKSESFQKTIFIIAAGLLFILAFFIFRGLRQKQKINSALEEKNKIIEEQKKLVENQKQVVEEQHKDITDSIKYAERIQHAILPPDRVWFDILPNSFVYYKPKDILSGDFYWIEKKEDLILFAAADCTGHGVPGALISIVNYNLLNKATLEKDLSNPAEILNYVNMQLIEALHQTYQDSAVKDGMDISLCVINTKTLELNFAGANNPIYVLRDKEITQISGDKFPVGAFVDEEVQKFNTKTLQLKKNDLIYLFSDGFADQFGGPKGKKYKYQQLKNVLIANSDLSLSEQRDALESEFEKWKGDLEQVDDVCVIGVKV